MENRLIKGSYQLTDLIEETPLCLIYRGEILTTRSPLLIKLYKKEHLGENFNEGSLKILAKLETLSHPGILKVFDHHLAHEGLYQILESPPGKTLAETVKEKGAFNLAEALAIAQQIGAALSYAQENGLLHGSLSPDKIWLGPKNQIKIIDFALVDLINQSNIVRANVILTEAAYLAPEQIRGGLTTSTTDVYGFGLLIYFMIKGQAPFTGSTNTAVALKHLREEPPLLAGSEAPSWLSDILRRALAKEGAARFQNPLEIIQVIRNNLPPPGQPFASRSAEVIKNEAEKIVEPPSAFKMSGREPKTSLAVVGLILFFVAAAGWLLYQKTHLTPSPIGNNVLPSSGQTTPSQSVGTTADSAVTAKLAKPPIPSEELTITPDLVGLTLKDVYELLGGGPVGIDLQGINYLSLDDYQKTAISRQEPAANTQPVPTAIKIWLNPLPPAARKFVPSTIGLSGDLAANNLKQSGFARYRVIYQKTKEAENGRVRWQSPASRENVLSDDLITLVVGASRTGLVEPLKANRINLTLPDGRFPWEVIIKVLDSQGEFLVRQGIFTPGATIDLPLVGVGSAVGKIYFNGVLVKEWNL